MKRIGLSVSLLFCFSAIFAQIPDRFYQNSKAGYRDPASGAVIVQPVYDACSEFQNGFAIVVALINADSLMKK